MADRTRGVDKLVDQKQRKESDWKLSFLRWVFLVANLTTGVCSVCYVFLELSRWLPTHDGSLTYVALGFSLISINTLPLILRKWLIHRKQLVAESEVRATIIEAQTVEEPKNEMGFDAKKYEKRKEELDTEIRRLERKGFREWTEYQILSLNQMIVGFLKRDELEARADVLLDELRDYAYEAAVSYDIELYKQWKERITIAKKRIEKEGTEPLKAVIQYLHQHLADYSSLWAEGSVIVNNITLCGALSILVLLVMGLLPLVHPGGDGTLRWFSWGFLGILGAVAGVLVQLLESNVVEVGNTEGRREVLRAIQGAAIGLIAAILLYGAISGEIISGRIFPKLHLFDARNGEKLPWPDTGLSIFWPILAGVFFRHLFNWFEQLFQSSFSRPEDSLTRHIGEK